MTNKVKIRGGCHCSNVRFTAVVPKQVKILLCNCSICSLSKYEHLIVPHKDFVLERGKANLCSYQFETKQAEHLFCQTCGVKSFYQPRSHPNAYSVHVAAIDDISELDISKEYFDGRNWEASKDKAEF